MTKIEKAKSYFSDGYACSQSVLAPFANELQLEKETAFKISSAFGGGIGRCGETCGAVTGAVMVLSMIYGKSEIPDDLTKNDMFEKVNFFMEDFKERNKTILCKELLGYDMSNPQEFKIIQENNICSEKCPNIIKDAIEILEEIII